MANLLTWLRQKPEISRYSLSDYIRQITSGYGLTQQAISYTAGGKPAERIPNSYVGYAEQAYGSSSVVGACMRVRRDTFRQAKFAWREITQDGTGKLKHDDGLSLLEKPWPNGTTGELLAKMITDVDLCGNSFVVNEGDRLRWRRPDWMYVVLSGDPLNDYDVDVVGYVYCPGGTAIGDGKPYLVDEVCHWSPIPHPTAEYVGMSWMTPALKDIQGDIAATDHKNSFFRNGTTLGPIFRLPATMTPDQFEKFKRITEQTHTGEHNAYRTLYVGGGAEVTLAASTFQQLEFKATQGGGETRVAALAGCHPAIVGLSEGLQGSSLNAGNFSAARRVIADITLFALWQDACAALSTFVEVPDGFELWIREQAIPLLREDAKDAASIEQVRASTITALVREGFTAESAVAATMQQNMTLLEHSGLTSVQLHSPGTGPDLDAASEPEPEFEPVDFGALRSGFYDDWDDEEIARRDFYGDAPGERIAPGRKGGGRFRKLTDRLTDLLEQWVSGDGPDDPLDEFSREQLRETAKKLADKARADGDSDRAARLTPRRMKPGEDPERVRAELKLALYQDAKASRRGGRDVPEGRPEPRKATPAKKAAPKVPDEPKPETEHRPRPGRSSAFPVAAIVREGAHSDSASWTATGFEGLDKPEPGAVTAVTRYLRDPGFVNTRLRDPSKPLHKQSLGELMGSAPVDTDKAAKAAATADRQIAALDRVMAQSRSDAPMTVYRGTRLEDIGVPGEDPVGHTWTDPGFASTSVRRGVAEHSFSGRGSALLEIHAPEGTPGLRIDGLGEAEILLGRGQTFRVVADHGVLPGGGRHLEVEVVPAVADASDDPEALRDALDLKKVPELKDMLRDAGLPVSGRKRELVDRLVEHRAPGKPASKGGTDAPDAEMAKKRVRQAEIDAASMALGTPPEAKAAARSSHRDGEPLGVKYLDPGDEVQDADGNWRKLDRVRSVDRYYVAGYDTDGSEVARIADYRAVPTRKHNSAKVPAAEAKARARQAQIDGKRTVADGVGEVLELLDNGVSPEGLRKRISASGLDDESKARLLAAAPRPGPPWTDVDAVVQSAEDQLAEMVADVENWTENGVSARAMTSRVRSRLKRLRLEPEDGPDGVRYTWRRPSGDVPIEARATSLPATTTEQAETNAAQTLVAAATEVESAAAAGASGEEIRRRLGVVVDASRPSDPHALLRETTRDLASSAGLTQIGVHGTPLSYEPTQHTTVGGEAIRKGQKVAVIRPGYVATIDGEPVVFKATVETWDDSLHGPTEPPKSVDESRAKALQARLDVLAAEAGPLADEYAKYAQMRRDFTDFDRRRIDQILARQRTLTDEGSAAARELLDALVERDGPPWGGDPSTGAARWDTTPSVGRRALADLDDAGFRKLRESYVANDRQTINHNASLRTGAPTPAAKSWASRMSRMVRAGEVDRDTTLHRGAALRPEDIVQLREGAILHDRGIVSTDASGGTVEGYADDRLRARPGTIKTIFQVRVPRGTPAASVGYGEVVLDRDNRFRIISSRMENDTVHVVMELLPRGAR